MGGGGGGEVQSPPHCQNYVGRQTGNQADRQKVRLRRKRQTDRLADRQTDRLADRRER